MDGRPGKVSGALLAVVVVGLTVATVWSGLGVLVHAADTAAATGVRGPGVNGLHTEPPGPSPASAETASVGVGGTDNHSTENVTVASVDVVGRPSDSFDQPPRVWKDESFTVTVTATGDVRGDQNGTENATGARAVEYTLCVEREGVDERPCRPMTVENQTKVGSIELSAWAGNDTTARWLNITVEATYNGTTRTVASVNRTMHVLSRTEDTDTDGLTNEEEFDAGTDYNNSDTDEDGVPDGPEMSDYETDPLSPDTDNDGARDGVEIRGETDPTDPDTDDDGLSDGHEIDGQTDPLDPDTDDDGLDDGTEIRMDTSPVDPDTDGDGIDDGTEVEIGTNPTDADTDGDFLRDGFEYQYGLGPDDVLTPVLPAAFLVAVFVTGAVVAGRRGIVDLPSYSISIDSPDGDGSASGESDGGATQHTAPPATDASKTLSDEERIIHLLKQHDGRMKQSEIVERTDWSKAKVSRTLSRMSDEGNIRKLQIGRENLITLTDDVPDIVR